MTEKTGIFDGSQDRARFFSEVRQHYSIYHNHKETISWTGLASYVVTLNLIVGFVADRSDALHWLAAVLIGLLCIATRLFLVLQFGLRKFASEIVIACFHELLNFPGCKKLRDGKSADDKPTDVEPSRNEPPEQPKSGTDTVARKGLVRLIWDVLVLARADALTNQAHEVLPQCLLRHTGRRDAKGLTHQWWLNFIVHTVVLLTAGVAIWQVLTPRSSAQDLQRYERGMDQRVTAIEQNVRQSEQWQPLLEQRLDHSEQKIQQQETLIQALLAELQRSQYYLAHLTEQLEQRQGTSEASP